MGGSVPKRLHCKTHTVIASAATRQSILQATGCFKKIIVIQARPRRDSYASLCPLTTCYEQYTHVFYVIRGLFSSHFKPLLEIYRVSMFKMTRPLLPLPYP